MTLDQIKAIVGAVTYKPGWKLQVGQSHGRPYVQLVVCEGTDAHTGKSAPWRSGKHYLSQYMCRQEIVGACYGCIHAAEEHEMREWFRYRGCSIYNPHVDPDWLVAMQEDHGRNRLSLRQDSMLLPEPEDDMQDILDDLPPAAFETYMWGQMFPEVD